MCRSAKDGKPAQRCASQATPEYRAEANAQKRLHRFMENGTPVTDTSYRNHLEYAYTKSQWLDEVGRTTLHMHSTTLPNGQIVWDEQRLQEQQQLMRTLTAGWDDVPSERKAIISGGLAGAGKTTILAQHEDIDPNQYVMLSPDDVKEAMATLNMIPPVRGLTPMEAATAVYHEAVYITNVLNLKAVQENKNLIYDTTMSSKAATVDKMNPLKSAGYDMKAVFVDIDVDTSVRRTQERHRSGLNRYVVQKEGNGGRLMPQYYILNQRTDHPTHASKNVTIFEELENAGWFTKTSVFDNNVDGEGPTRVR